MARTFLPTADNALLNWAQNFDNLLSTNFAAYGLPTGVASAYSMKFGAYQMALAAAKGDQTRGKSTVYAKDEKKRDLIAYTRLVAGQISRTMTVTNQQRSDLGLIVRKAPSKHGPPTTRPTATLSSAIMRMVDVRVFDESSQTKRGKAPNTIGAKVYTFVGAEYPSDPTLWAYQGDTTNGKFSMTFPNSVPNGTQVWICAAWFNRTGETGPISIPISTNVQGGGTAQQQQQQRDLKIAA
jgi:hypothetical protein